MTATQVWLRNREDDGHIIPGSLQAARLYADRVEFEDGTVVRSCPWNPELALDTYLYTLDYQPVQS